jgi:hypothetical protein
MTEAEERGQIIEWIKSAMKHADVNQARLNSLIWPNDRSILGKILLKKRRAQIGELAEIAARTGYPLYVASAPTKAKRDPAPRLSVKFHVREWREFCEVKPPVIAKALRIDEDELSFLENKPHKFSIEQITMIASALKVNFDSLRWNPQKIPAPEPSNSDIKRIRARARA